LFLLVVNAAMLGLVAAFLPGMGISSFWAAFWAAIIVSIVSWIGNAMFQPQKRRD
jgi:putative membrane protein